MLSVCLLAQTSWGVHFRGILHLICWPLLTRAFVRWIMRLFDGISALFPKACHVLYLHVIPARGVRASRGTCWHLGSGFQKHHERWLRCGLLLTLRLDLRWGCRTETLPLTLTLCSTEMRCQLRLGSWWIKSEVCNTLLVSSPELKFIFTPHSNYWTWNYFVCL